jgi:hypothetical protein
MAWEKLPIALFLNPVENEFCPTLSGLKISIRPAKNASFLGYHIIWEAFVIVSTVFSPKRLRYFFPAAFAPPNPPIAKPPFLALPDESSM